MFEIHKSKINVESTCRKTASSAYPSVSIAVWIWCFLHSSSTFARNSHCTSGSPPPKVTPPLPCQIHGPPDDFHQLFYGVLFPGNAQRLIIAHRVQANSVQSMHLTRWICGSPDFWFIVIAPLGTGRHTPAAMVLNRFAASFGVHQVMLFRIPSGLAHHWHRSGQPLRNTSVLAPGPS